jgi:hypothetical protein
MLVLVLGGHMGQILAPYQCDLILADGTECPNTFVSGVSFSILTQVPSPDPRLAGFTCPQGQHQYCSWDHATQGQAQCFTNHLLPERAAEIATWNANPNNVDNQITA